MLTFSVRRRSSGLFLPSSVSGALFWQKVGASNVTIPSRVTEWRSEVVTDLTARKFVQSNASQGPAYQATGFNGQPALQFDSAHPDFMYSNAGWSVVPGTPLTMYAVMQITSKADLRTIFDKDEVAGNAPRYLFRTTNTNGYPEIYSHNNLLTGSSTPLDGGSGYVVCVVYNGASSAVYVNDVTTAVLTGTTGTNTGAGPFGLTLGIAGDRSSYPFHGFLAAFMLYQGAHDLATRSHIMKDTSTSLGPDYSVTVT
jgi:hypothetical protein